MKPIRIVLVPTRSRPLNIFLGLMLLLVSLLLLLSLATYHASDPSFNTSAGIVGPHPARNWIGLFGAYLSDLLLQSLGITSFFLPIWIGGLGWSWMHSRPGGSPLLRWVGTLLALVFLPATLGLISWHSRWLHLLPVEGVVGRLMAGLLVTYINIQGAWLVAGAFAAAGIYFATAVSFNVIAEGVQDRWIHGQSLYDRWRNWREERAERKAEQQDSEHEMLPPEDPEPIEAEAAMKPSFFASLFRRRQPEPPDPLDEIPAFQRAQHQESPAPARPASIWERTPADTIPIAAAPPIPIPHRAAAAAPTPPTLGISKSLEFDNWDTPTPIATPLEPAPARPSPIRPIATPLEPTFAPAPTPQPAGEIAIHHRAPAENRTATVAPKNVSGFKLPPSTLLNPGEGPQTVREDDLREEAKVLVEKCAEFDVRGQVVQINPGPMVTTYEFKPEAGVKYSRVTGLADDLCLAMRAESILIERMAGKSTVGIQVPNHERETIHLREVIESETFSKSKSRLTIAMGKDINGRIVTADLASMPHVLIAGSTGSGKSVAINAMIMSLLFRTTPSQVRLILVDPKRVELGMYEGVPHLFTPIITEPKLAANALRNAVREMERRLKLLASRSVRNIEQYNKLFDGAMPSLFDDEKDNEPLPFIVIIIDELADLMMLDRANVEESITRLAQMARAVGIHLVLATQRPSVDVITGLIKANVPTRISFRLATKVDSRTILDTNGAEALLGRGDMLFLPPGTSRLMRLHAPYVSEKETAAIVAFWKAQGQAEYVEGFLESPKDERVAPDGSNPDPDENDPMFDDAVRLVFEFGKASTSLLQRRLRIGYGRAAHLIDLMERDGLVGAADGSRPRELLKAPGWLHEVSAVNE
ncbi:MAG: DNA translocase FtsK [Terracidiphilus sp.]|jgi:S-DNA-T family DNA segregation ATPase FtsK/SpoIIIE